MGKGAFSFLIILLVARHGQSLFISDGIQNVHQPSFLHLNRPSSSSSDTCEQTYGFLPCTTTILGNLFLMLVYGYLMLRAAICLSTGSELLLNILGSGVIGGFLLPVLGAFPDALLILVSGLSGSKETAQNQVSIGMGLLAGSTVMLLTWLWGSCVVVGKCDLSEDSTTLDSQDSKWCSLIEWTVVESPEDLKRRRESFGASKPTSRTLVRYSRHNFARAKLQRSPGSEKYSEPGWEALRGFGLLI